MFAKLLLAAIALQALLVRADPEPSVPGPGDTYKQGGDCVIEWGLDPTGKWTDMQIELKTGNNLAMIPLKVITTIDATKESKYVYPCPKVSPNSAIYFYEFTSASSTVKYWTTRFTITDENGNSTPPTETTQPNGDNIPWGTGSLLDDSGAGPDPSPSGSSSSDYSSPGTSSPPPSSSSSTRSGGTVSPSTSRSTSTPAPPSQTGSNSTSQNSDNSASDMVVAKALVFMIGLVTASTLLL